MMVRISPRTIDASSFTLFPQHESVTVTPSRPMTTPTRKLKGINFTGTLSALARVHGDDVRDAVVQDVPGEVGEALRLGSLVASGWYPAAWYAALLQAIVARVGGGAGTTRQLAREAVKADFRTLFKVMSLLLAPQRALQQSLRVSRRYVDGGEIEMIEAQDGFMHYRLSEYYEYTHLMWWDFIGGVEGVLDNLGAEQLEARIVSGGQDGDHEVEFTLRWKS